VGTHSMTIRILEQPMLDPVLETHFAALLES
jgi:hypothetical protein